MKTIMRRPPVDWFRVLAELKHSGLSQCAVARIIGVSRSRVKHWSEGSIPGYDDGRALIMLWRRTMITRKQVAKGQRYAPSSAHDNHGHPSQGT